MCAWSTASPADLWLQIAASIEESQARLLDSKIQEEGWGYAAVGATVSRASVFKTVTFGSASANMKGIKLHIANLKDLFDSDKASIGGISKLIEFAIRESSIDIDLYSPAIAEIALAAASVEDKQKAVCIGSRAIFYCVTELCLGQLLESVGSAGAIDDEMISGCVALESFEELFVSKGIIEASEGQVRVQLETLLEKTKRQVTVKVNALFEGIVKLENFSILSQQDGSSSSSNDMCSLLSNLTRQFIIAKVPIANRWWGVPIHVMMSVIDRYIEFNVQTGDLPSPVLPKVVHKTGALAMFKPSEHKHVIPGGRRPSLFDFTEEVMSSPEGTTLWGSKAEHKRLTEQRMEELVARYCNMEKVAEFLASLEGDLGDIAGVDAGEFEKLPMAADLAELMERVQARKKNVLTYLSHKIVLFDL